MLSAKTHPRKHSVTSTKDHEATAHRTFYSDGSGDVQELAHGTSGQVFTSNGASSAPSWEDASAGASEWNDAANTWTYSSWNSTVRAAVFTVAADVTSIYTAGKRVKFDQTTDGTKYGIVAIDSTFSSPNTTVTLLLPSGTDFDNETITNAQYSSMYAPTGFDPSPDLWSFFYTDTANNSTSSPTANTWYNAFSVTAPIGTYYVECSYVIFYQDNSTSVIDMEATLSTANNSESDSTYTSGTGALVNTGAGSRFDHVLFVRNIATYTSATTLYANYQTIRTGMSIIALNGTQFPNRITFISTFV